MSSYYIKHKTKEMYIHYNPHISNYYIDDKIIGAVLFHYNNGISFMESRDIEVDFHLIPVNLSRVDIKKNT